MTEAEKVVKSVAYINNKFGWDLYPIDDEFSCWDSQSADVIVEFKFRNTSYVNKYIQVDKFYKLLMACDYYDKLAYYIVRDSGKFHYYNLNCLKDELLNSKIKIAKAPYSTEFKDKTKKIDKYFYILEPKHKAKL